VQITVTSTHDCCYTAVNHLHDLLTYSAVVVSKGNKYRTNGQLQAPVHCVLIAERSAAAAAAVLVKGHSTAYAHFQHCGSTVAAAVVAAAVPVVLCIYVDFFSCVSVLALLSAAVQCTQYTVYTQYLEECIDNSFGRCIAHTHLYIHK
jgi:hypothetical protein